MILKIQYHFEVCAMDIKQKCKESYARLENLKLVAEEIGIPWQTVYVHLKALGVQVKGNKEKYGSESDKFATKAEKHFMSLVPEAKDMNNDKYQARFDFNIEGLKVDVKSSRLRRQSKSSNTLRWAFSVTKQESIADFMVCIAYEEDEPKHYFLLPSEIVKFYSCISVSMKRDGKWWDYEINPKELRSFFKTAAAA
jgi:hypothetical protein